MDYDYTWEDTGNITEKDTEHGTYVYGYDDVDRLTDASYPTFSSEEWTYDPLGNRLTDVRTGDQEWQYNANNELLDSVEQSHEYDDNGSLIAEYDPDGSLKRTFEYNAENRMSAVRDENDDLIAEYLYDPFGRRVSKTVYEPADASPDTTWYVYSDQGLMAELDQLGNSFEFYLFPPEGLWSTDPILRGSGSNDYFYQTDHLGTPQKILDGSGAVVHSREMRGFGQTSQTGLSDVWQFPGQVFSEEVGLSYNYFRYFSHKKGRYTTFDPVGLAGGRNLFSYANQNPITEMDSKGLYPEMDLSQSQRRRKMKRLGEALGNFLCGSMAKAAIEKYEGIALTLQVNHRHVKQMECERRCYVVWAIFDRYPGDRWCLRDVTYFYGFCPHPDGISYSTSLGKVNPFRTVVEIDKGVFHSENDDCCDE
jgi:RHS repeat-associated protein